MPERDALVGEWRPISEAPGGVRLLRTLMGLTQEQLAEVLDVSLSTVQSWEQGVRRPRVRVLRRRLDETYEQAVARLRRQAEQAERAG